MSLFDTSLNQDVRNTLPEGLGYSQTNLPFDRALCRRSEVILRNKNEKIRGLEKQLFISDENIRELEDEARKLRTAKSENESLLQAKEEKITKLEREVELLLTEWCEAKGKAARVKKGTSEVDELIVDIQQDLNLGRTK